MGREGLALEMKLKSQPDTTYRLSLFSVDRILERGIPYWRYEHVIKKKGKLQWSKLNLYSDAIPVELEEVRKNMQNPRVEKWTINQEELQDKSKMEADLLVPKLTPGSKVVWVIDNDDCQQFRKALDLLL